jgi:hypothetical protein
MTEVAKILAEVVRRGRIKTVDELGDDDITLRPFTLRVFCTDGRVVAGTLVEHNAYYLMVQNPDFIRRDVFIPYSQVSTVEVTWHEQ